MDPPETQALDPKLARALIRSLTRGTSIAGGAKYIHVGHMEWLAAQEELLDEISEDGFADTKFVRGAYGSGKSHFLAVVQEIGLQRHWITAHVECSVDGVQIDRFETLYPKITSKLQIPDGTLGTSSDPQHGASADPLRTLLDRWSTELHRTVGIRRAAIRRPFDAEERVYRHLEMGLMRSNLPPAFTRAAVAYSRASLSRDYETQNVIKDWLKGGDQKVAISNRYLQPPNLRNHCSTVGTFELRPIGTGTASEAMHGLLWLVRAAGYRGLILCIDEVEELAKLATRRRRDQALQALREHVDNAGGDTGYRYLCLYLAATPEMFVNSDYFPRYDALATRIMPVGTEINWRAPVIDLDATPLSQQQMKKMARRILEVHRTAYGESAIRQFPVALLDSLVNGVMQTRFQIAKPRLLARILVDEFERARQRGSGYRAPDNIETLLSNTAERIAGDLET